MNDLIKIDTNQLRTIADSLSKLNDDLLNNLNNVKKEIQSLENVWEGDAARATREAVNQFSAEYFQSYHDMIQNYVEFLRRQISQGYETTETSNTTLADAFK